MNEQSSKMKKIKKESLNPSEENLYKLKNIFPEVFSEGKIDFEKLKIILGNEIEDNFEKYNFTWAGRSNSFKNIQTTAKGTLIPDEKDSIDFDKTENLFIEGDNLEVLKLLQKSYQNKIKMIYIDPPYNTGKDFVYKDNFRDSIGNYEKITGQVDEEGNRTDTNKETNGRFHSDWLTMMYPRLYLAKNLLKDDGVIFVSIDDHEVHNLRKIMDDIFGEENFISCITREAIKGGSQSKDIRNVNDYVLIYTKDFDSTEFSGYEKEEIVLDLEDGKGKYARGRELNKWGAGSRREDSPGMWFPIKGPKGEEVYPIRNDGSEGRWRLGKKKMHALVENGDVIFEKRKNGTYIVYQKIRDNSPGIKQFTTIFRDNYINAKGTEVLKNIFDKQRAIFDYSKPIELIEDLMILSNLEEDDIILDFFAGSGTTAHAVLDLNKDGGNRKFICVQLPEKTDEKSEAFKAGYKTIAEISKERIRRVIKKIKEEDKEKARNMDLGFKVFKLSKSNYKIWENYDGKDAKELLKQMELFQSPLIAGYKKINLIYEVLIKEGYDLNSKIEEVKEIKTNKVFRIDNGEKYFYICLDEKIKEQTIKDLKLNKDIMFVCLDESLDDNQKINLNLKINLRGI